MTHVCKSVIDFFVVYIDWSDDVGGVGGCGGQEGGREAAAYDNIVEAGDVYSAATNIQVSVVK